MESIALTSRSWPGFCKIKHLVIFGASYCDVGYDTKAPHPSPQNPLGVEYPGDTWAGPGKPNWVGHLVKKYASNLSLLVYNFAKGGDRVDGVRRQLERQFLPVLAKKPEWAPWKAEDTLFMTWVGINDCAWQAVHEDDIRRLFEIQEELYQAGARNFLFINVPPINRSPAAGGNTTRDATFINWNTELRKAVHNFTTAHDDASAMIFSSWDTFTRVLDDPVGHGFPAADARKAGGAIWVDRLHPTSGMHDIVARDLAQFLDAQAAYGASRQTEADMSS